MHPHQCPVRHIDHPAATSTNREGEYKYHDLDEDLYRLHIESTTAYLGSAVQGRREEEIVLPEPARAIAPEIKLRKDCEEESCEHRGVDPHREVSERPYMIIETRKINRGWWGTYSRGWA